MESNKSLDEVEIIAALLHDVHSSHGVVFNNRSLKLTLLKVRSRVQSEGISFLTKTLPTLGKAFDKALSDAAPLTAAHSGFKSAVGSCLPIFMGEFFSKVLCSEGRLLPNPCAQSVKVLRQVLYLFYKYELPYSLKQEQQVIDCFVKAEDDLSTCSPALQQLETQANAMVYNRRVRFPANSQIDVVREAQLALRRVFLGFDPLNITPRHGPGAVATKQRLSEKFVWSNIADQITSLYPWDAYFCASPGAACDTYKGLQDLTSESLPARVLLVPKDSRGPRLISCEPVDYQWVQQGLASAIVELVESHPLTKWNVNFTDQVPNRCGAQLGSLTGKYATLDLKEASDRVSLDLVRLLFPPDVFTYLGACRSLSTVLPNGQELKLQKFAPMGSSLCFPIMALTIWAILFAAAPDAETRERFLVYGDDVIVPTAYAANAIEQLESFGLKVNHDKSCTRGLFRESCGKDAFQGIDVTPVRFRTVWSSLPDPSVYASWISYANSFYDRQYFHTYDRIVSEMLRIYGNIPGEDMQLACPSLRFVSEYERPWKTRTNRSLQKRQYRVRDLKSPHVIEVIDGWSMLLRYFTEAARPTPVDNSRWGWGIRKVPSPVLDSREPFSVSSYTSRKTSVLVTRWR